ncbi:hypothetical protein [Runella sp. SP2]|uniref:hypothetical protein n=1 Tax=Runella sp. SP2 TaxID=2268026 RepID=UPI000F0833A7|nr:hypothetical protein [Runella sp. SP2]AYQ31085.1 hypothetical protein DTQ70_02330 [Runella sp. SP2]
MKTIKIDLKTSEAHLIITALAHNISSEFDNLVEFDPNKGQCTVIATAEEVVQVRNVVEDSFLIVLKLALAEANDKAEPSPDPN